MGGVGCGAAKVSSLAHEQFADPSACTARPKSPVIATAIPNAL